MSNPPWFGRRPGVLQHSRGFLAPEAEDSPEVLGVLDFDIGLPAVGACFMFHHTPQPVGWDEGSPAEFGDADPVVVGVVEVFVTALWVTHGSLRVMAVSRV